MDNVIHKISQVASWLKKLDTENFLILGGGLIAFCLLINWLWKRGRSREKETGNELSRTYVIPSQPLHRPAWSPPPVDDDIKQYNDVTYIARPLMSQTEINFWRLLFEAAPGYHIFPQVTASSLLNIVSPDSDHFGEIFKILSTATVDFVLCDPKLNIVAVVELDNQPHGYKKNQLKDYIISRAGYRTVRFDSRELPNVEHIKNKIFS